MRRIFGTGGLHAMQVGGGRPNPEPLKKMFCPQLTHVSAQEEYAAYYEAYSQRNDDPLTAAESSRDSSRILLEL